MPYTPIEYDDVEVLDRFDLGWTVRIGNQLIVVSLYVPLTGTEALHIGDRGRMVLPKWFAEQWGLPIP